MQGESRPSHPGSVALGQAPAHPPTNGTGSHPALAASVPNGGARVPAQAPAPPVAKPANVPRKLNVFQRDQQMTNAFWQASAQRVEAAHMADVAGVKEPDTTSPFVNGRDLLQRLAVFHTAHVHDKPRRDRHRDEAYVRHTKRLCDKAQSVLRTWDEQLRPRGQHLPGDPVFHKNAPSCAGIELQQLIVEDERRELGQCMSRLRAHERRRGAGQNRVLQLLRQRAQAQQRAAIASAQAAKSQSQPAQNRNTDVSPVYVENIRSILRQLFNDPAMRNKISEQLVTARQAKSTELSVNLLVQTSNSAQPLTQSQRLILRVPPPNTPWANFEAIALHMPGQPVKRFSISISGQHRQSPQPKPTQAEMSSSGAPPGSAPRPTASTPQVPRVNSLPSAKPKQQPLAVPPGNATGAAQAVAAARAAAAANMADAVEKKRREDAWRAAQAAEMEKKRREEVDRVMKARAAKAAEVARAAAAAAAAAASKNPSDMSLFTPGAAPLASGQPTQVKTAAPPPIRGKVNGATAGSKRKDRDDVTENGDAKKPKL